MTNVVQDLSLGEMQALCVRYVNEVGTTALISPKMAVECMLKLHNVSSTCLYLSTTRGCTFKLDAKNRVMKSSCELMNWPLTVKKAPFEETFNATGPFQYEPIPGEGTTPFPKPEGCEQDYYPLLVMTNGDGDEFFLKSTGKNNLTWVCDNGSMFVWEQTDKISASKDKAPIYCDPGLASGKSKDFKKAYDLHLYERAKSFIPSNLWTEKDELYSSLGSMDDLNLYLSRKYVWVSYSDEGVPLRAWKHARGNDRSFLVDGEDKLLLDVMEVEGEIVMSFGQTKERGLCEKGKPCALTFKVESVPKESLMILREPRSKSFFYLFGFGDKSKDLFNTLTAFANKVNMKKKADTRFESFYDAIESVDSVHRFLNGSWLVCEENKCSKIVTFSEGIGYDAKNADPLITLCTPGTKHLFDVKFKTQTEKKKTCYFKVMNSRPSSDLWMLDPHGTGKNSMMLVHLPVAHKQWATKFIHYHRICGPLVHHPCKIPMSEETIVWTFANVSHMIQGELGIGDDHVAECESSWDVTQEKVLSKCAALVNGKCTTMEKKKALVSMMKIMDLAPCYECCSRKCSFDLNSDEGTILSSCGTHRNWSLELVGLPFKHEWEKDAKFKVELPKHYQVEELGCTAPERPAGCNHDHYPAIQLTNGEGIKYYLGRGDQKSITWLAPNNTCIVWNACKRIETCDHSKEPTDSSLQLLKSAKIRMDYIRECYPISTHHAKGECTRPLPSDNFFEGKSILVKLDYKGKPLEMLASNGIKSLPAYNTDDHSIILDTIKYHVDAVMDEDLLISLSNPDAPTIYFLNPKHAMQGFGVGDSGSGILPLKIYELYQNNYNMQKDTYEPFKSEGFASVLNELQTVKDYLSGPWLISAHNQNYCIVNFKDGTGYDTRTGLPHIELWGLPEYKYKIDLLGDCGEFETFYLRTKHHDMSDKTWMVHPKLTSLDKMTLFFLPHGLTDWTTGSVQYERIKTKIPPILNTKETWLTYGKMGKHGALPGCLQCLNQPTNDKTEQLTALSKACSASWKKAPKAPKATKATGF